MNKFFTVLLFISILISPMASAFAFSNGQAASIVIGQPDFTTVTSGTGASKFTFPQGAALDATGNLWVADGNNNRVLKFSAPLTTGMAASVVIGQPDFTTVSFGSGTTKMTSPTGVAFDSSGNLLVADIFNHRVLKFTAPLTTGMAASVVIGQPDFTTVTSGTGTSKFNQPNTVALDSAGNLLVAENNNNRVLKFLAPLTTGMAATTVIGQPDFTTVTSGSGTTKINFPRGIALDSAGNLLVAEAGNNRVLKFSAPLSTGMAASIVIGQPDFTTVIGGPGNNKLGQPNNIALDSAGNLFVLDRNNQRALKFSAPLSTGMAASIVIGQTDFTSQTSGTGASKFTFPQGVALDSAGNLLVTDTNNHRVLQFLASSFGSQVTNSVTISGTCGLSVISGSPVSYGTLSPGATSTEQTLVLDNTGSNPAALQVKGTNWLDVTLANKMNVDNTKFSTASGTYASKTSLLTTDQTITAAFSPTTNLNTFWQLQVNLLDSSFAGALTQTMDFTATC